MSEWLKNTVPGIILLGAIGSILAAVLIWLAGRLLVPLLKSYIGLILKLVIKHFVNPAVSQLVQLHFLTTENKIQLFYTLQVMKVILALFFSLCAFIVFIYSLSASNLTLLRSTVLVPLVISFLGLWYALRCIVIVMVPLYYDVESEILRVKNELPHN